MLRQTAKDGGVSVNSAVMETRETFLTLYSNFYGFAVVEDTVFTLKILRCELNKLWAVKK